MLVKITDQYLINGLTKKHIRRIPRWNSSS